MSKDRCGRFKEPLQFGHESYVVALRERLKEHFEEPGEEPALVAGLFGEWGCGKTAWLRRLEWLFEEQIGEEADDSITVPVFFNAWRFEKEEHLIVPLLKTAQEKLAGYGQKGSVGEWLKDKAELMGEVVAAVAHGLKGKLSVPFVAELEVDPGAVLDYAMQAAKKSQEKQSAVIDRYASIYFDLVGFLETLTGRPKFRARRNWEKQENGRKKCGWLKKRFGKDEERKDKTTKWKKLNLLFLIDDLDRCLPEKAVEMLEAIKLFLEVEGCAFVLGIDDEVVDRGILHRYRDYNLAKIASGKDGEEFAANGAEAPITGSEYLEKIIHLPVRVPPPGHVEVRRFLSRWGERFFRQTGETGEMMADAEGSGARKVEKTGGEEVRPRGAEDPLLEKLAGLIPPVPRKIVRAGELLCLLAGVNESEKGARIDRETLALLGLVQLFAPELYRRLRRNPDDLLTLCLTWPKQALKAWESPEALEGWLKEREANWAEEKTTAEKGNEEEKGKSIQGKLNNLHRRWRPLAAVLAEVAAPRSGFDVYKVLNEIRVPVNAEVSNLRPWFALVEFEKEISSKRADEAVEPESRPIASLRRTEAFLEAFRVQDPGAWAAVVEEEREALRGRILGKDWSGFLMVIAEKEVAKWESETRARWLAALKPWVGAKDFKELQEAAQWENAREELEKEDVEPKKRNVFLALRDAAEPRRGVGLDADGLPDIEWVKIPEKSRRFVMGASEKDKEADDDERSQHEVVLTHPFEIARYPVTRTQFGVFLNEGTWANERWWGADESWGVKNDALKWLKSDEGRQLEKLRGEGGEPVTQVSWYAAMAYCRWLSSLRGDSILLPTEAQWECAVRASHPMAGKVYPWGSGEEAKSLLLHNANMSESGIGEPSVVGAFPGGRVNLGSGKMIDDMIGNVWEWCWDGMREYPKEPESMAKDPRGSMGPVSARALRGGGYWYFAWRCRCASRYAFHPGARNADFGFRLVRVFRQAGPQGAGGPERSEAEAGQGAPRDAGKDLPGASGAV